MKLNQIKEMAVRGGDLTSMADDWAEKLQASLLRDSSLKSIGQIDSFDVKKRGSIISVWSDDVMVAAAKIDPIPEVYCEIDDIWIKHDFRGKKMLVKLLLFIKNELHHDKIAFGNTHSDETFQLLKAGGLKAFKKVWRDWLGNERPFSVDTIHDFYGPGRWKLVLENTQNLTGYIKPESFTHSYEALANAVNEHDELEEK